MFVAEEAEGGEVGGCSVAEATLITACLIARHMRSVSVLWPGLLGAIRVDNGWTSPVEVGRGLVHSDHRTTSEDLWSGFALPRPARQGANPQKDLNLLQRPSPPAEPIRYPVAESAIAIGSTGRWAGRVADEKPQASDSVRSP